MSICTVLQLRLKLFMLIQTGGTRDTVELMPGDTSLPTPHKKRPVYNFGIFSGGCLK